MPDSSTCNDVVSATEQGNNVNMVYNSFWVLSPTVDRDAWKYCLCRSRSLSTSSWNDGLHCGSLCQQLSTIAAHRGSTSFGISKRWFMNPTAPITCIELRLSQGIFSVASSHNITPKLYTSDFSSEGSFRRTSGAIH